MLHAQFWNPAACSCRFENLNQRANTERSKHSREALRKVWLAWRLTTASVRVAWSCGRRLWCVQPHS